MKGSINTCNLYVFILVLWMLSNNFSLFPSIVTQGILGVFLLFSIYYAIYANLKYKLPVYYKALNVLLIMFTIYGIIMLINGERYYIGSTPVSKTYYLVIIYVSLLPIYASYVFARKGLLIEKNMKFIVFVFLILTVILFFRNQAKLLQMASESGSSAVEFTNNVGYAFVGLLPALVLFYKKPILQYLLMAFCVYFIILGMKRGAILAGGICLLWFIIVNLKESTKQQKQVIFLISVLVIVFGVYFFRYMMENSLYFMDRVAQTKHGNSSGRDVIYSTIFDQILNENKPFRFLFGYGADATLMFRRNYAHNDWLEIAVNQGLLGVFIYLVYWIYFFVSWSNTKHHSQAYMAIGMILIVYFLLTFFSMSYNSVSRCAAFVLGYYLAVASTERQHSNQNDSLVKKEK